MKIDCGNRRIVSDRYGFKIELKHVPETGKSAGIISWVEDRPAYPATLADAFEEILLRELRDQGDMALSEVPDALREAYEAVIQYSDRVRDAA